MSGLCHYIFHPHLFGKMTPAVAAFYSDHPRLRSLLLRSILPFLASYLLCCSNCLKTQIKKNFFSPQKIPRQPIESSKNMPERIPHSEQHLRSSCSSAYPAHCKPRRASLRQGPCPRVLPLLSTLWICHLVGILVHGAKSFYCLRTDASLPGLQKSREK